MAPASDRAFAFFDVDETLIVEKSMFTVLDALGRDAPGFDAAGHRSAITRMRDKGYSRASVNRYFYRGLAGLEVSRVERVAAAYFADRAASSSPLFIASTTERLRALADSGISAVAVSGSAEVFIRPVMAMLGIRHVLATRLATEIADRLTGEIKGACMIGEGKTEAVHTFLEREGADAAGCWGFGDHLSDFPFLEMLGHPHIVAGNADAVAEAGRRGWPVLDAPEMEAEAA
ncbi:HAD family hydrolase [Salipiger mucosus]|uniref:HAD-superfamily subfamily IB hydrolase n=1 Tax=Salipiger mucosus DSM 16094 TaxID=1123237 RepID=S9Q4W7_9RHOB|nr:HAD-IB family hydrolase [Salipiger mucosus]EPX76396.1 HAD-superfamily subfamily IB hydrolase [Salipiger mucosus DSM 16094]